jgi:hypothetical protein
MNHVSLRQKTKDISTGKALACQVVDGGDLSWN